MSQQPEDGQSQQERPRRWDDVQQDIEAEQSLLGAMLVSETVIEDAIGTIQASAYFRPAHKIIYGAITDLYLRGEVANPITVGDLLDKRGELTRITGRDYLYKLVSAIGGYAAGAEQYIAIVKEKAELRAVGEELHRGLALVREGSLDAGDIASRVEAGISKVLDGSDGFDSGFIGDCLDEHEAELKEIQEHGPRQGVKTGFADLDSLTNGLQPGWFVIVAGRPAMGKSVIATDVARHAAIQGKQAVALYSLEMSKSEVVNRLFAATGGIALHHLHAKDGMTDEDWARYRKADSLLREARLMIRADPNRTVTGIHAECRRLKRRGQLDIVIIDYLQLLQSGRKKVENRQAEVSEMSRQLKLMAKDLDVPVVVLAQLNRGPEQRQDKRPVISDLRESGSLEQDCDLGILVHREDAYEKESPRSGEADFIVAKYRHGPTATITVAAQMHFARFVDMAQS